MTARPAVAPTTRASAAPVLARYTRDVPLYKWKYDYDAIIYAIYVGGSYDAMVYDVKDV